MKNIEIRITILIFLKNCEMNFSIYSKFAKIRYVYKN